MTTPETPCANWNTEGTNCPDSGKFTCGNCHLVAVSLPLKTHPVHHIEPFLINIQYYGPECQTSHWPTHKAKCKSALGKANWTPDWFVQGRQPAFVGKDNTQEKFGGSKYLWGNVPALDILRLGANEGKDYNKKLNLLFAG